MAALSEPALLLFIVLGTISPENRSPEWADIVGGWTSQTSLQAFNKLFFQPCVPLCHWGTQSP